MSIDVIIFMYIYLCGYVFLTFDKYQEIELLGDRIDIL